MGDSDVGVGELAGFAAARGLQRTAELLRSPVVQRALEPMEPVDAALLGAASRDPQVNLEEMARRGPDPGAAAYLTFLDGALERGLLAWDLLAGSLWPVDDEPGLARRRALAEAIAGVLPAPGGAGVGQGSDALAEVVARSTAPSEVASLIEAAKGRRLSAMLGLRAHGRDGAALLDGARFHDDVLALGSQLDRAHLPTTASAYLAFGAEVLHDRRALAALVDLYADVGAPPPIPISDPWLQNYLDYRLAQVRQDAQAAFTASRRAQGSDDPHARIVVADLAAVVGRADGVPLAEALVREFPTWRFAARVLVRAVVKAQQSPLAALDAFLARFGNDERVWLDLVSEAPPAARWADNVRARAVREAYALPHDPAAWRALGLVIGDPLTIVIDDEVAERLHAQSEIAR